MYKEYFGLKEAPFSIAPDPRYLYMSEGHREALAHLIYGIGYDGGFVLLTGEVGAGKTTVCRCLLEQVPEDTTIAFIMNPRLSVVELLATVCDDLGIRYPKGSDSVKVFVDALNTYLLDAHERGRRTVLIIEEAQNLSSDVLEQLRLLTNLETSQRKLLQIIMLGQPELREKLARPELLQLAQRITARYHLGPLSKKEVAAYVAHRLDVAGGHAALFPPSVVRRLYRLSGGVPRLINILCDRALLGLYVQGKERVDVRTLSSAAREVLGKEWFERRYGKTLKRLAAGLTVALFVAILVLVLAFYHDEIIPRKNTEWIKKETPQFNAASWFDERFLKWRTETSSIDAVKYDFGSPGSGWPDGQRSEPGLNTVAPVRRAAGRVVKQAEEKQDGKALSNIVKEDD